MEWNKMKHKLLKVAIASLGIASAMSFITNSTHVQATTWYSRKAPYFVTRRVKLKRNMVFHRVKVAKDSAHDTFVSSKKIKKGAIIKVRKGGASWDWIVSGHGMKNSNHYFWVTLNHSSNWFTTQLKKKMNSKVDESIFGSNPNLFYKQGMFYNYGVRLDSVSRVNITRGHENTFDGFFTEHYIMFKATLMNFTKQPINVKAYLQKHVRIEDNSGQTYPVTNYLHNNDELENWSNTESAGYWEIWRDNFDSIIHPGGYKTKKIILFGGIWVPSQNDFNKQFKITFLDDSGSPVGSEYFATGRQVIL